MNVEEIAKCIVYQKFKELYAFKYFCWEHCCIDWPRADTFSLQIVGNYTDNLKQCHYIDFEHSSTLGIKEDTVQCLFCNVQFTILILNNLFAAIVKSFKPFNF